MLLWFNVIHNIPKSKIVLRMPPGSRYINDLYKTRTLKIYHFKNYRSYLEVVINCPKLGQTVTQSFKDNGSIPPTHKQNSEE